MPLCGLLKGKILRLLFQFPCSSACVQSENIKIMLTLPTLPFPAIPPFSMLKLAFVPCVCMQTFDRRYNLKVHYRRHTNETPYPCKQPGCALMFKWRSSLAHHMKTRHKVSKSTSTAQNNLAQPAHVQNTTTNSAPNSSSSTPLSRFQCSTISNDSSADDDVDALHLGHQKRTPMADSSHGASKLPSGKRTHRQMTTGSA